MSCPSAAIKKPRLANAVKNTFNLAALLWILIGASIGAKAEGVLVFAAASTTVPVSEIISLYASLGHGPVSASFAASSTLAKQIANGAPADIYISANPGWMDYLELENAIDPATRIEKLSNTMVLVAPADSSLSISIEPGFALSSALGGGRLAIGDPDHVPAGIYAMEALKRLGVWSDLSAKAARMHDVRAVLALVERGEAAAGVVYASDAAITSKVRIVSNFPPDTHPPIIYPAAMVAGRARDEVRRFFDFLQSPEAIEVFRGHGFSVIQ
ncbi:MAG: molybdate ABC transporter substrate-binding protein [Rhodospirillales bacterium]